MPQRVDLNDIRHFLAVAENGSVSAAARALGTTQPTVGRRIRALESALGARLFERTPHGYVITSSGKDILDAARRIEDNLFVIVNRVGGKEAQLDGKVRLATSEGLGNCWLAPKMPGFAARYPGIELDVLIGTSVRNLLRREADIALRVGTPGSDELVGKSLGKVCCALYAAPDYLARHGEPAAVADLPAHQVIESTGDIASLPQVRLLRELSKGAVIALTANSLMTQLQAVREGLGIAALPSYMTAGYPDLVRVLGGAFELRLDLWLVTHRDLRSTARIRAVREFIADEVARDTLLLTGIADSA